MKKILEKMNKKALLTGGIGVLLLIAVICVICIVNSGKKPSDELYLFDVSGNAHLIPDSGNTVSDFGNATGTGTTVSGNGLGLPAVSGNETGSGLPDVSDDSDVSGDSGPGSADVSGDNVPGDTDVSGDTSADPELTPQPDDIDRLIASMTLHEKVCQMIIATPGSLTGERNPKSAGNALQNALANYPVGGLIFDSGNISNAGQITSFLSTAQSYSEIPLILTLDEEGGRVTRLQKPLGTTPIGAMYDYREMGPDTAYLNASIIASDIKSFGFNLDLAPVADVWSNPENTVIGDRAYSDDFLQASQLISSAVQGFHSQGIPCTLKHFPGHGDSSADSHYGSVYVYKTLAEMRTGEFLTFKAGIDAGADCVMMGHLIVKELGDIPAPFSSTLIKDVLRGELGFNGVVMTDSLKMKAMIDYYNEVTIAVNCVNAGCDILLMPNDVSVTVTAIETAVQNGYLSETVIDESVRRILALKLKYGILDL